MDSFTSDVAPVSFASAALKQHERWIDIRDPFNFYDAPPFPTFSAAVHAVYPGDPKVIILKMTGPLAGVFKIISSGPPVAQNIQLDKMDKQTGLMGQIAVPLALSGPGRR